MAPRDRPRLGRLIVVVVVGLLLVGTGFIAVQSGVLRSLTQGTPGLAGGTDAPPSAGPTPDDQIAPTTTDQERQAELVEAEDDRLLSIVTEPPPDGAPYEVATDQAIPTTVLTARARPYDLPALKRLGAVVRQADGSWLLTRSVLVGRGAELRISEPGATLRLTSGPAGFTSLIAFTSTLALGGPDAPLTITSWDPATSTPDTEPADGRAYVRTVGGRMDLTGVDASDLGFWSGRTGGVAWTGSSGEAATGSTNATSVSRSHYGVFISDASGLSLDSLTVADNELDGLLLHRDTDGVTARGVVANGNGRDGIAIAQGAQNITLTDATASTNGGNGVRIDGSPLATTATPGGVSIAAGSGYSVERSTVTNNGEAGLLATQAEGLRLIGNTVFGNRDGILVRGVTERPQLADNRVDADDFGIAVRHGVAEAQLTGNQIGTAVIGVQVLDASADLTGNNVTSASRYGASLVGEVGGSSVNGNVLAGRGLAPVDTNRVAVTASVDLGANDETGWVTDRDELRFWLDYVATHPLLLLWGLILLPPIAAQIWYRRHNRQQNEIVHPYAHVSPGPNSRPEPAVPACPAYSDLFDAGIGNTVAITSLGRSGPRGPQRRHDPRGPRPTADPGAVSATTALPVTRVTVVSGEGSRS